MHEIITINTRINQIDLSLRTLRGELAVLDHRADYSVVTISVWMRNTGSPLEERTFGENVSNVFGGSWSALGAFFRGIVYVIVAIFPFLLVIGVPVATGVFFLVKYGKRKNKR
jgi:hypothetical protein